MLIPPINLDILDIYLRLKRKQKANPSRFLFPIVHALVVPVIRVSENVDLKSPIYFWNRFDVRELDAINLLRGSRRPVGFFK